MHRTASERRWRHTCPLKYLRVTGMAGQRYAGHEKKHKKLGHRPFCAAPWALSASDNKVITTLQTHEFSQRYEAGKCQELKAKEKRIVAEQVVVTRLPARLLFSFVLFKGPISTFFTALKYKSGFKPWILAFFSYFLAITGKLRHSC